MPIRNYTTEIAAEKSISEIQSELRKVRIRSAYIEYGDDGEPAAVGFQAETAWGLRSYILPADIDGVERVLAKQIGPKQATRERAVRVAWRLAKDWVAVQVAYVQAGAAKFEQVMLPYLRADEDGTTVFEWFEKQQLMLPKGNREA